MRFSLITGQVARRRSAAAAMLFTLVLATTGGAGFARTAEADAMPGSFADLAERLSPAVVNISTTQTAGGEEGAPGPAPFDEFPGQRGGRGPQKVQSLGSGFVIDASGVIVTNNHVIADADRIDVTFADGTTLPARIKGRDEKTDIAVLKVDTAQPLAHVALGDSGKVRVGDWVMAIGNPFGLGGSVTAGIVSALNRDIHAGNYDDFIQTDAAINRGNSGGPLFALNGAVIGMNTAIISPTGESVGIGFAVPASTLAPVVAQILKYGETRRGWIGVRIQNVTKEIAGSLGLSGENGALVAGVTPGGPAAEAGIETGDVIVYFDGRKVREMRDLPRIVAETEIGRNVTAGLLRGGKRIDVEVKVVQLDEGRAEDAEKPAQKEPAATRARALGLDIVTLTPDLRRRFDIGADVSGVLVSGVAPSSAAAEKGVRPGDVIVEVAQRKVGAPGDVVASVAAEKQAGRKSVLLRLLAGGNLRFVAVPIGD
jgi:serine protease Do